MSIQSPCDAPALPIHVSESLRRPPCPRCGSMLLLAEQSAFSAKGRICHSWSCDECGNTFVTSIRLRPR